jgi:AcrR family transcriptional regulator
MTDPPREREFTAKQRAILDAALDIFAERGFAGTATAEIAKRAGVAEATIFKTWKTKKDLLVAVVAPVFFHVVAPRLIADVRGIVERPWPDLRSLLRALVDDRLAFLREHQRLVRVVLQELPFHPEVRRLAADVVRGHILPLFVPTLKDLQQRGHLRSMPPERAFRFLVTNIAGWGLLRFQLAPEAPWDDDAERDALIEFLVAGLGARTMAPEPSNPSPR